MSYPTDANSDKKVVDSSSATRHGSLFLCVPEVHLNGPFRRVKHSWKKLRHPATIIMGSIMLSLFVLAVGVFWGYQKEVYKARSSSGALTTAGGSYLQGQLEAVDPVNSIFTVTWITGIGCEPLGQAEPLFNASGFPFGAALPAVYCGQPLADLNIYTQENASSLYRSSSPTAKWSVASGDLFSTVTNSALSAATQSFTTSISFDLQSQIYQDRYATLLAYPFDQYTAYLTFLISRADTNATVPVFYGYVQSSIPNWNVYSTGMPLTSCTGISLDSALNIICTETADDTLQRFVMKITAKRASSTIAFVSLIWLTSWLLTLVIVWTTIKITVLKSDLPPELILVPVTALFSLPAVRGVMPDSPDFGAYHDVCGFLFCITLISLCAALVLVVGIRRNFALGYKPE